MTKDKNIFTYLLQVKDKEIKMEIITIKMEPELLKKIDETLKENLYSTRTEFIREAIRTKVKELEKEKAIQNLIKYRGFLKGQAKTNLTDREIREKVSKELEEEYNHL